MPYCPRCGGEFVDRVSTCPDCEVALVAERPAGEPSAEPVRDWETVLETGEPALLAAAQSVLQSAGVPYLVIGEGLQNLEGSGVLGVGYNVVFGAPRLRVPADRAEEARALLSEEAEPAADPEVPAAGGEGTVEHREEVSGPEPRGRWGSGFVQGAGVGLLIGIVGGLAIAASGARERGAEEPPDGVWAIDGDGDGRVDYWPRYEDGILRSTAEDLNRDGEQDSWVELDRQVRAVESRLDQNFDGEVDEVTRFVDGRPVSMETDSDYDGEIDRWTEFDERGLYATQTEDRNGDGRPDRWYEYDDAQDLRLERADSDYDGEPDDEYEFDSGSLVAGRRDTDHDGTFDLAKTYRHDQLEYETWEARPGAPARRLTYRHGTLREELRDGDGDGAWDLRIVYDRFEYPAEEIELP